MEPMGYDDIYHCYSIQPSFFYGFPMIMSPSIGRLPWDFSEDLGGGSIGPSPGHGTSNNSPLGAAKTGLGGAVSAQSPRGKVVPRTSPSWVITWFTRVYGGYIPI